MWTVWVILGAVGFSANVTAMDQLNEAPEKSSENARAQHQAPPTREQLQAELEYLKKVNQQIYSRIQNLERQIIPVSKPQPSAPAVASAAPESSRRQTPSEQPRQVTGGSKKTQTASVTRKKAPERSASVENLLSEEHALFDQTFSLELDYKYAHFDRSELILRGFLALDAIFLGELSVDEIEGDIITNTLTARWGATPRLQFDLQVPYLYRVTKYRSRGQELSSLTTSEVDSEADGLGDASIGISYRLFPETLNRPDIVWNARVTAPTGTEPYGIDIVEMDSTNNNLNVPITLPTGTGLWSASSGFSFVKTSDPAILFASINYTRYLADDFDDIGSDPETTRPGRIQLGDAYQLALGVAFALNDRLSYSFSYAQQYFKQAKIDDIKQVTTDAVTGTFNLGVTYALTERLAMVTSLGLGLTGDTSDYSFSIKFPYRF